MKDGGLVPYGWIGPKAPFDSNMEKKKGSILHFRL